VVTVCSVVDSCLYWKKVWCISSHSFYSIYV